MMKWAKSARMRENRRKKHNKKNERETHGRNEKTMAMNRSKNRR